MKRLRHLGPRGLPEFWSWILFCCTLHCSVALRDSHFDSAILEDPTEDLARLDETGVDASYMDCLRRWADQRQRQQAFWQNYGHLLATRHKVQRLHLSLRASGPIRNVTLLVSDLQHRLGWLSDASSRYAEHYKMYVDTLRDSCKNATLRTDDFRKDVLNELNEQRRAATLDSLKSDISHRIAAREPREVSLPRQRTEPTEVTKPTLMGPTQVATNATKPILEGPAQVTTSVFSGFTNVPPVTEATKPILEGPAQVTTSVFSGFTNVPPVTEATKPILEGPAQVTTSVFSGFTNVPPVTEAANPIVEGPSQVTTSASFQGTPPVPRMAVGASYPVQDHTAKETAPAASNASNASTNVTANTTSNNTVCPPSDDAMLISVEPKETKDLFLKASGASTLLDSQKETYLYGKSELDQCRKLVQDFPESFPNGTKVQQVSNNPLKISLPCLFNPQATLLCNRWLLQGYEKVILQAAWGLAFLLVLVAFAAATYAGHRMRKAFLSAEASKLSKDDISRLETEALMDTIYGDRTAHVAKVTVVVMDVCTVALPVSNVIIYALATEKTYFPSHESPAGLSQWCADWHDVWLIGSMCLVILLQAVRAASSSRSPRYAGSGRLSWLVYLLTDVSSVADSVAVALSCCSFLYCRAVHWNWMIFSFVRVIESLGHWGVGVNFHGFSHAGNASEDRRMLIAMSSFGLVMWVLIGSLYYAVNNKNAAARWETAMVIPEGKTFRIESWQRFESIPSSMFFALLNLYKKNPLALAFDNWHEQLLVIFVNLACVPIFSLVAGMIGSAVSNAVCAKDPNDTKPEEEQRAGADEDEEYEEEEEEEEEQEEDPIVEGIEEQVATDASVVEQWHQIANSWMVFLLSLTWEDHFHPALIAILGFGSLFFYGITTSCMDGCKWLSIEVHRFPPWAHPLVDGAVGAVFLGDWITSSYLAPPASRADGEDAEDLPDDADAEATVAAEAEAANTLGSTSLWRHAAYFIASVPGIVQMLLVVASGLNAELHDKHFFCLCSLWRIYLLEKWLDHPFWLVMEAIRKHKKALTTTGAVSVFFWFLGAHLLFFSEFRNPDENIHQFYGSLLRSIWASSIFLNGEWVFCDFSWAGKAVGCFIVLFGVSIVVVPMMVFSGEFMKQLLGDFFETQAQHLKAEEKDLWQLKMEPPEDAAEWRKEVFGLLYAHLQRLRKSFRQQTQYDRVRVLREERPWKFQLFKWASLSASLIFTVVTLLENSQYMNSEVGCGEKEFKKNGVFRMMGITKPDACRSLLGTVDIMESRIDLVFLHFFILEFLLRYIALGWRHLVSELGVAEMCAILGLSLSLTKHREDALHRPAMWESTLLGTVVPLRLCRLVSVGSYFGVVRALRKVISVARWPLVKSFYFLVVVWYSHAMLLHFAESDHTDMAIAGAQVRAAKDLKDPLHEVFTLEPRQQSKRFGDYLSAMQYSLLHLTGDYPIVQYTIPAKILLIVGLVVGTCAIVVWTAIFSSGMVNYLANEAIEDPLAKAVEHRMLLAIEVVTRIQRKWRRRQAERKRLQEQGGDAALPEPAPHQVEVDRQELESALRKFSSAFPWERFFQITLLVNVCVSMLCSLPEVIPEDSQCEVMSPKRIQAKFEAACLVVFGVELVLTLRAGSGREGKRWYAYRAVDFICLLPGLATILTVAYEVRSAGTDCGKDHHLTEFFDQLDMLLTALRMIRVLRVLFWRQWKEDVQVFIRGVTSTGPILAVPVFMSLQIWVVISSLFVFTENTWKSPTKDFFKSVPSAMYWTSSFLIGEWTLADFSSGAGSRVCIFTALFGIMGFAIPMGILMEGVKQSMVVDMMERLPLNQLAEYEDSKAKGAKRPSQQSIKAEGTQSSRIDSGGIDKQQQLKRAAKLAAMARLGKQRGGPEALT